jgi:RNA polymerase sigma-70 factor (ECF subfamily)
MMRAGTAMGNLAGAIAVPHEEAAFVAELQAGDEYAFAQLIGQYQQPIYSLVARSLQDPADAADITQEIFLKVFRSIGSFHCGSTLRTWIYRIALHEASNQRRWWQRHKRQELTIDAPVGAEEENELPMLADTLACHRQSPFDDAADEQLRLRVEEKLRQVPEAYRNVLILREIEGFGYEEIAEIVGCNLGTVKSRLTRGRGALRELLLGDPSWRQAMEAGR